MTRCAIQASGSAGCGSTCRITWVRILSTGVPTDPSSIVPTRDHPNGRRLRASRSPSRGEDKRTQTRSNPVTSRFRNHWRDLALRIGRGDWI